MSVRRYFLFGLVTAVIVAADEPVRMSAIRVSPSDLYFKVGYLAATDEVMEIRVTAVARGSAAEKAGIREGDLLSAIRGVPVVGMKRGSLYTSDGRISVSGKVTFTGQLGIFRRPWSIIVEATSLREKPNKAPEPTTLLVTPRADARVAPSRVVAHL